MLNRNVLSQIKILLNVFSIGDKPAGDAMPPGQIEIAASIILKLNPRTACLAPTGYGKSEALAMGAVYRSIFFQEDYIIGSVKYGTSEIIMEKVIDHLFDDEFLLSQLELEKGQELQRLKRERRKDKLTFKRGGSLKVVSFHGADTDVSKAIGEHVPNIILDESPLLSSGAYLQVLKILEGTGNYNQTFLFELGNAVNRNHFMNNILYNPRYYKINISLEQSVKEGRLDEKSIDEKRGLPFFQEFYECRFPDEDAIDAKGYRQLLTMDEILNVQTEDIKPTREPMRLGVDVGGGGDYNTYCILQNQTAWFEASNRSNDTMTNVNEVIRIIDKYKVDNKRLLKPENVFIDDIGIGRGVTDRLKEMGYNVTGVSVGEKAQDVSKYKNKKAENYWLAGQWIKNGGKLLHDEHWQQMTWIKYKVSTDKVLQIEPKEDLKGRTGRSCDWAESMMLCFSPNEPEPSIRWI